MIWHQQHKKAELSPFFKSLMKSSELSVLHAQVHMLTLLSAPNQSWLSYVQSCLSWSPRARCCMSWAVKHSYLWGRKQNHTRAVRYIMLHISCKFARKHTTKQSLASGILTFSPAAASQVGTQHWCHWWAQLLPGAAGLQVSGSKNSRKQLKNVFVFVIPILDMQRVPSGFVHNSPRASCSSVAGEVGHCPTSAVQRMSIAWS